ncbi:MAG: hypothetical protein JSS27_07695 [Planctomycetes bacterium]|nr:hypothetical protein [Planctomycetota bacterium]
MNTNSPRPESNEPESGNRPVTKAVLAKPRTIEEFSAWMDEELELLEARWIRYASPNARRMKFGRNVK